MTRFEWKADYCVGEGKIDAQHEQLFMLANKLVEASDKKDLTACAMHLFRYVHAHFRHEESVMRQVGYPGYAEHYAMHEQQLARLTEISADIHNDRWTSERIVDFMENWLKLHILKEDVRLAAYLKDHRETDENTPHAAS